MELLQEIFLYDPELMKRALTGPADLSLIQSIFVGTGVFVVAFIFHVLTWWAIESTILTVCYPRMTIADEDEYRKRASLTERVFLTRARREATKHRIASWFYWLLHMFSCALVLVSVVIWIATIVTRRKALAWLSAIIPFDWFLCSSFVMYIYSMLFIPEEREVERERYRWKKK